MTSMTAFSCCHNLTVKILMDLFVLYLVPGAGEDLTRVTDHKKESHLYDRFSQRDHLIEMYA